MRQHFIHLFASVLVATVVPTASGQQKKTVLFDGESLDGWEFIEKDKEWWTVKGGMITGGSLTKMTPRNTFLSTKGSFQNFELTLKIRIRGAGGFINSGIQIRSMREPGHGEMIGYQVDAGDGWWGKMYDEARRRKVIAQAVDLKAVTDAIRKDDWNEYRILAEGKRIRSWINDVPALDYTEQDPKIPLDGKIGIQVHGKGKALIEVKDVVIRQLPPTPGAMIWEKVKRPQPKRRDKVRAQLDVHSPPRTPEEELKGFTVPDGFEVELVAAESDGIGKFVAVAFDAEGRLWTMTAVEYPVDANENAEASKNLFARGGRDKVLVIDQLYGEHVSKPRVFADGLVMPLGVLPYKDGVYVQYGNDIRLYRDTDDDGKADMHEVVLSGFGTQDSHLFPHQFTRTPGGWILTAQGLFNRSTVHRPNHEPFANGLKEIPFNQCKLARLKLSGSDFELLTAGPNNIWGLTISREGETWLQEANDLGYPVIPFEPGGYYQTGSREKLRAYQPLMPPTLTPPQMGGTGLSGLALGDDFNGWPAPWGGDRDKADAPKRFYVANPITSSIQVVQATSKGGRYVYQKLPDFLVSKDPKFRPVSIQFGPDGCLYITDWYNKIISHNEVPRNHPERDKTRGRIWRIRHKAQPRTAPPNLRSLAPSGLLAHLGSPNARIADMAWQEIVDRQDGDVVPELKELVAEGSLAADRRLGALWALEGLATVPTSLLESLSRDSNASIRHESVRIAAAQKRPSEEFLSVARMLVNDPSPRVRAALGNALRHVQDVNPEVIELMLGLGKAPLAGDVWATYDRSNERFLARWAMERHSSVVAEFLASERGRSLPVESRVLATLAVGGRQSAVGLAELMSDLNRPLTQEEIRVLASHFGDPKVSAAMAGLLNSPISRESTLRVLLALRTSLNTSQLKPAIVAAAKDLWQRAETEQARQFVLTVAGAFRLKELDASIAQFAGAGETRDPMKIAALRCLGEMGSDEFEVLAAMASSDQEAQSVRNAALDTLAESPSAAAAESLAGLLLEVTYDRRKKVIERMATSRTGALALLEVIDTGDISPQDITPETLQTMRTLLPKEKLLDALWERVAGQMHRILRLSGNPADFVHQPIDLSGPFTVESWVRLRQGISNADGILGCPDVMDMNFYDGAFRVWVAGQNDVVIAKTKTLADTWTHLAVSRDDLGTFCVYVNGELSATSSVRNQAEFAGLNVGRTTGGKPRSGTEGALTEYRVWDVARSPQQIRDNFDRSFAGDDRPAGLIHYFDGSAWGKLGGKARIVATLEAPNLLTAEQAALQTQLFDKYRALASHAGDKAAGKSLFTKACLVCHKRGDEGGNIGPPLDGVGLTGAEALLRNILTPSAAMEGGYRQYRVLTYSGKIHTGMLVSQDDSAIVLRQPDVADLRIEKSDIQTAAFTSLSVMPSGILDDLKDRDVSNLFAYLLSLKPKK